MAAILAHIQIKPGKEAVFEETVRALYTQSHAQEKDLLRYEYWRGQKPGLYYCLLSFTDYAGFMAHQTSAHHEAAIRALGEALQSIDLEWIDPVPDAADAPPTVPMALDESASALAKAYAQQIPVRVAGWWRAS
jgi:quinol monooxygenase YgiN